MPLRETTSSTLPADGTLQWWLFYNKTDKSPFQVSKFGGHVDIDVKLKKKKKIVNDFLSVSEG